MKKVKRLYSEFKPERYELYLEPDRGKMAFSGKLKLTGRKTGRPSRRLTLHQKGLKITSAKVLLADRKTGQNHEIEISRINAHKAYDELRLHTSTPLHAGQYTLELEFSGRIKDQMHGIYPCNFLLDGQKKQLIATQFESHHAREAFPCIDEPEAKAVFSLSLKTPAAETVVSNTPVLSESKHKGSVVTLFEDTPKMSTYLLAFAYGELGFKQSQTKNGVAVRVYATPANVGLTDFALDTAVKTVEFFENYFGVPYPLPKLDLIGLPDFSAGAMENWGLITFREQVLYVDPRHSSVDTKQFAAMIIGHEIAHMWFGNLVTMRWWNDLWLNESFANLMEYRVVDELFPDWRIWEEFAYRETGSALARDALPNVQPVRTEVNHPDELNSLFDPSIVYAKGGNLLNMARNLIGEYSFRAGLKSYFTEHKYSNTDADDLWRHLGKSSGTDIKNMMKNWLEKPGYPLVEVSHKPGDKTFSASQQRLIVGKPAANSSTIWQIPLAASYPIDMPVMSSKTQTFSLKPAKHPLVLNHNGLSYFISRYSEPAHFESILAAVRGGGLSPIDRLLLVQSYLLLERAGRVGTVENLKLLEAFGGEREEAVWSMLSGVIGNVKALIGINEPDEKAFNGFLRPIVLPLIEYTGWEANKSDTPQMKKMRSLVTSLGASSQIKEVIDEGLDRFKAFSKPADLAPDIRSSVYYIAVRFGAEKDFDKLLKAYKTELNAEHKEEIAAALTSAKDPKKSQRLLAMIKTTDVRPQDGPTWFAWILRNKYSTELAWKWLKDNWNWVETTYGDDKSYDRFARYSAMVFSKPRQLAEFKTFFEPKSNTALERAIKLGIEEIEGRIAWRQANEPAVKSWLNQFQ